MTEHSQGASAVDSTFDYTPCSADYAAAWTCPTYTLYPHPNPKEDDMNTVISKVRIKRQEKKVNDLLDHYGPHWLHQVCDLERIGWDWFPAEVADTHMYAYAAVRADGRWYVTGSRSPQGVDTDGLIDFLIDLALRGEVRDLTVLVAAEPSGGIVRGRAT
jgi:hypothetical protein